MITCQEKKFINLIAQAANRVEASYFKVPVNYGIGLIVRERVFCYELYHQIRSIMNTEKSIFPGAEFHAEIDKGGNSFFDKQNPDFVLHVPGTNEYNTLVMEVKGKLDSHSIQGIKKDFTTLNSFIILCNYKIGVFLIYNHTVQELMLRAKKHISAIVNSEETQRKIFVVSRTKLGRSSVPTSLYDLFRSIA